MDFGLRIIYIYMCVYVRRARGGGGGGGEGRQGQLGIILVEDNPLIILPLRFQVA